MKWEDLPFNLQVLISLPRALWSIPTPELRFIALKIEGARVSCRFGYDAPIDDDIFDLVSSAETYLYADYASTPGVSVTFTAEHVPQSQKRSLRDGEEWHYLRYERTTDG